MSQYVNAESLRWKGVAHETEYWLKVVKTIRVEQGQEQE
jgi:hypothetical protein